MGYRHDDSLAALRAYARELDAATTRGELVAVGGLDQDGAPARGSGSGGPRQLAIAAVAAGVVLIGSIGIAAASGIWLDPTSSVSSAGSTVRQQRTTQDASPGSPSTIQAVKAFNTIGMPRSAAAVETALDTGMDTDPSFVGALERVREVVADYLAKGRAFDESTGPLGEAVNSLLAAIGPPGLDPSWLPPGQGGTPPGQDPSFVVPGEGRTFIPPGQDPAFTPPGREMQAPEPSQHSQDSSGTVTHERLAYDTGPCGVSRRDGVHRQSRPSRRSPGHRGRRI